MTTIPNSLAVISSICSAIFDHDFNNDFIVLYPLLCNFIYQIDSGLFCQLSEQQFFISSVILVYEMMSIKFFNGEIHLIKLKFSVKAIANYMIIGSFNLIFNYALNTHTQTKIKI